MKKLLFILGFSLLLTACSSNEVVSISHAHGLAVDSKNPNRVLIATHEGLLSWEEGVLSQVGSDRDDLMGFMADPGAEDAYYSSGHPRMGGNMGVQQTKDNGESWKILSMGLNGPVDFHAMAISSADPKILYGWFHGSLQRTVDGAYTWEAINSNLSDVITLNGTSDDANVVYAGTTSGLMKSSDKGASWSVLSEQLSGGAVIALAINSQNPNEMLSFSEKLGMASSVDGGLTWAAVTADFGNDYPLYMAYSPSDPQTAYLVTKENILYQSLDGGQSWTQLEY